MKVQIVAMLSLAWLLAGCESSPVQSVSAGPPKSELRFLDLQGFDQELSGALGAPLPRVDVAFYDRVTPSSMPERLQQWLASVETGGGTVKVVPPKSTVTAKSPFLLISAATTIYSASKMAKEMSFKNQFKPAQAYDAEILLKVDDKGDTVVDKVVFVKRGK